MDQPEPVELELAPLPREQLGPFLILGIDKDADAEQIDAAWAERIKGARRGLHRLSLEDINWARETVLDPARRVRATVTSLNLDTVDGALRQLMARYGLDWQPRTLPLPLDDDPPADLPNAAEIVQAVTVPEVALELPILPQLIDGWRPASLDPWTFDIGMEPEERHE